MAELNEEQKNKVNEAFNTGTKNFTQDDLNKVMEDSETAERKSKKLGKQFENFKLLWRLLKDYHNGVYKQAPWKLIAAIGFAVAYLILPIDIVPDFIPIIGFIDDATVFALVISAFQSEIDDYKEFLQEQEQKKLK